MTPDPNDIYKHYAIRMLPPGSVRYFFTKSQSKALVVAQD